MATRAAPQGSAPPAGAGKHPAVRDYTLVCLVALLLMAVVLAQEDVDWWWPYVPVLLGSVALLGRWAAGPPLVLLGVTGVCLARVGWGAWFGALWPSDPASDLLLAVALLAYTAAHYRLQSLTAEAVPDGRRGSGGVGSRQKAVGRRQQGAAGGGSVPARRWFLPAPPTRSPEGVRPGELLGLLVGVPLFAVLAFLAWGLLVEEGPFPMAPLPPGARPDRGDDRFWQAVLVAWAFAGGLAAAWAVLGYLRWVRSSPEEAVGYLQDQLWRHTRREQRRANRWVAWCRLRRQRRKEGW